jgi:hypothetical protein
MYQKSSCLAMAFDCSVYLKVLHRALAWLGIDDFYRIMYSTNAAAVDSSLQVSIYAQAVGGYGKTF